MHTGIFLYDFPTETGDIGKNRKRYLEVEFCSGIFGVPQGAYFQHSHQISLNMHTGILFCHVFTESGNMLGTMAWHSQTNFSLRLELCPWKFVFHAY